MIMEMLKIFAKLEVYQMSEPRLIDANALDKRFDKRIKWLRLDVHDQYSLGLYHGAVTDKDLINEMSIIASDVAQVRHGRWNNGDSYCPICRKDKFRGLDADVWADWQPDYCPNCGAKMDGGTN